MISTNKKVVINKGLVEVIEYEYPIVYRRASYGGRKSSLEPPSQREEEHRRLSVKRAAQNLLRLLAANFPTSYKVVTLTFSNESKVDVTDMQNCNNEFSKFIKRLRNYLEHHGHNPKFKYIGVMEFQDSNQRGSLHFHIVTDLPYISNSELQKLWKNGNTWIEEHQSSITKNLKIAYYLSKGINDPRLKSGKCYKRSHNLINSKELIGEDAEQFLLTYPLPEEHLISSEYFESNYRGKTTHATYFIPESEWRLQHEST
ncbi:hypothetical protein AM501_00655 [Aneurinibacillus migulanus]|uniref:rolling circle replication-associated protein n=1 Tax=Aneurinibacillus migulanus TaxID=47500 RepID=UPI0005BA2335|nr:hypothetical protein [Aneurinibacillus migulanus]KIV59270.1 hypothetical protein TS64_02405 [Aneurinibacillus migulanus]KPD10093.1 hypothetical protein AM501_00655 [Aneurinibacillus migulanus]